MQDGRDIQRIEDLVERHAVALYRFALRMLGNAADAEDMVQETYLIAQKNLAQLRGEGDQAKAWLFKILRSCRARLLSRRKHEFVGLEIVPDVDIADPSAEEHGILEEVDRDQLAAALKSMPDEFREPLILFYFQEFRYREIAEILAVPIGTVMSRLARAKAHLRKQLLSQECGGRGG